MIDLFDQWAQNPQRESQRKGKANPSPTGLFAVFLSSRWSCLIADWRTATRPSTALTNMSLELFLAVIGISNVVACYVPMDVAVWGLARIEAALSELAAPVAAITSPSPCLQLPVMAINDHREWLV